MWDCLSRLIYKCIAATYASVAALYEGIAPAYDGSIEAYESAAAACRIYMCSPVILLELELKMEKNLKLFVPLLPGLPGI